MRLITEIEIRTVKVKGLELSIKLVAIVKNLNLFLYHAYSEP